jgi:hypothetical protein
MRRKITDVDIEAEELPELTPQQQEFVRHILAGKTASDAYRLAYNTENMLTRTVWAEASRLRNDQKVSAWLAVARKAHLGTAVLTKDQHMQELERLREIALRSGNVGAAVQAEQIRGKVAGYHVDRVQDVTDKTDIVGTLREIAEHSPELAASLAAQHGIAWKADEGATKH